MPKKLPCGVLVRISDDRRGEGRGVGDQEADCRTLAERRGWPVDPRFVYVENDTSAYQRRKVRLPDGTTALRVLRPEFRRLVDDITAGRLGALVAYDLDRVARDPRDLEDLIDAVEAVELPTATVTGDVDLSSDSGVFMARMMVNVANKSSRDTSRRVRRAMETHAATGRPTGGGRPFGYSTDRLSLHRPEAAALRWAHEQVGTGRSLRSVALTLAGYFPDRRWDAEAVRRLLTAPRTAGLRVHRGAVVGPATWQPIVSVDQLEQTTALLDSRSNPSRAVGGPRRYMLTGLLVCGRCSTEAAPVRLYPRRNADRQRFGCLPARSGGCGGSLVLYEPVEALVDGLVRARLREVEVEDVLDDDRIVLRGQIADLERQQEELGEQLADDPSALLMVKAANRKLAARIDELRRQIGQTSRSLSALDPAAILAAWDGYDSDQRRAVVEVLIEKVVVGPHGGGPRFDPARLDVVWR